MNAQLMTQGFRAAGPNAIVISALPQLPGPLRYVNWGHTAVGVRVGGEIQAVRGFNPQMLELLDPRVASEVYQGLRGVPGQITSDVSMLTSTRAMTLEIPVSAELAQRTLAQLPQAGPRGAYTAMPSVQQMCVGENCVQPHARRARR